MNQTSKPSAMLLYMESRTPLLRGALHRLVRGGGDKAATPDLAQHGG
jgi:hypothetical protein